MDADRWARVQHLFDGALEQPSDHRHAWVRDACGDDAALCEEVLALLDADTEDRIASIVADAAVDVDAAIDPDSPDPTGDTVGPYRIERELGRGGMGVVYLASRDDGEFTQQVAIKVVRGRLSDPRLVERFRNERQILARLNHPNIARLLDGGATDAGEPYVVMEYVEGEPLDRYCADRELPIDERLRLFLDLCDAVRYAHRNLIVHRDIKPSNVLVTADGTVKLLDFGVARLLGEEDPEVASLTRTTDRVLTPRYGSPEQFTGDPVTTASDVYSLGVVLYELLTGCSPYRVDETQPGELERAVREQSPERPSTLGGRNAARETGASPQAGSLRGDLDNVVLMALRKEPDRRYASAAEFADDLRRYRDGMPVMARPSTAGYRARKFIGRHKVGVAAAAAFVLVLIGTAVISTVMFVRASRAEFTASEVNRFLRDMLASIDPATAQGEDTTLLRGILEESSTRIDGELGDHPEVAASLHETIGSTYGSLGMFDEAERHHRAALELYRDTFGPDDPRAIRGLRALSIDMRRLARYEDAETYAREALERSRATFGEDDLETATDLHNLGVLWFYRSDPREAERWLQDALRIRRDRLENDDPRVAETLIMLAATVDLPPIDDIERAEQGYREAYDIFRRAGDRYLAQQALALHNLGETYTQKGEYDEAERSYLESIEIKRRILPPDHPETAVSVNRLASLYETRGDYARAEETYREALGIQRRSLPAGHRDIGTTLNNLGGTLRKAGRPDEAAEHHRQAVEIYANTMGPEHAWVAIAMGNLVADLEAGERWAECESAADECLRLRLMTWEPDHWRVLTVESIRAACIVRQGRRAEGEPELRRTARQLEADLGPDHAHTRDAMRRIDALP